MYAFRVTVSAVGLLQKILTNTPLLNEGKVKFLQIKQDTVQQNMKRDVSVSAYEYMKHDILLPLCASVNILDDPLHSPSCVHNSWMAYFSTKRQKYQNIVFTRQTHLNIVFTEI